MKTTPSDSSSSVALLTPRLFSHRWSNHGGVKRGAANGGIALRPCPVSVRFSQRGGANARFSKCAFTLIELLVVLGIIGVLATLLIPALSSIQSGRNLGAAAFEIAGILEQARAYAMVNNTHVFVGFGETDASISSSVTPQVAGTGRIAVVIVASKDGTSGYGTDPANWDSVTGSNLVGIGKMHHFENIHLSGTTLTMNGKMARPSALAELCVGDNSFVSLTPFAWPLGKPADSAQYYFQKVIEFDPQGSTLVQSNAAKGVSHYLEIGLQQAAGAVVSSGSNIAVIQIDMITGANRIYRP